jgi:flagellar biosynthesis protein FliQ
LNTLINHQFLKQEIMNEEILIPISLFLAIFGIVYLYLSTRNRERLALIEKGADASIFMGKHKSNTSFSKIILLNLSLLLMGIGVGVFIALILTTYTSLNEGALYPASIFTMAGVALFVGFNMTKKLD